MFAINSGTKPSSVIFIHLEIFKDFNHVTFWEIEMRELSSTALPKRQLTMEKSDYLKDEQKDVEK